MFPFLIKARTIWGFIAILWIAVAGDEVFALDLRTAVVLGPANPSPPEAKAVQMLIEEVEKRTHVRWKQVSTWPTNDVICVVVSSMTNLVGPPGEAALAPGEPAGERAVDGYRIEVQQRAGGGRVLVAGNDPRGTLFGVGHLLRNLAMKPDSVTVSDDLRVATRPRYPLRGHQLGYRPKTNSYDAWDLDRWEQYFRDLAIFGCNAIELIPPRSDDDATSPHFPKPPLEMMVGMSRLAAEYGLEVWVWYPAMDTDYSDSNTVDAALREWGEIFGKLPRLDAVFVPGGDPGHTEPRALAGLLEKQTVNLRRFHPNAQMWVSPQGFGQEWLDEFLTAVRTNQPEWLSGLVYGPQIRISLPQLRAALLDRYPIRHYPDITHSRQCQYPVPDWDTAYAVTEARECINPRPIQQAAIFRATQPYTAGFITYSEGCNDDVNKAIWSGLGWNPDAQVTEILRDYSRYFIGADHADSFAQGLLGLERNWQGPLLSNEGVYTTLASFQALERAASETLRGNWRFQQALFRAYYDAYTRRRLLYETELEERALEQLRRASHLGSARAMSEAMDILDQGVKERTAEDWSQRIFELAESLYRSIGMQLSVEKHKAIAVDRGAMLDTLDYPLNNRLWLKERFSKIRKLADENERLAALAEIVHWTDPGAGGFYDDLGNIARQPHLVKGPGLEQDPGCYDSPRVGFEEDLVVDDPEEKPSGSRRMSWIDHAESLFDAPLRLRYDNLDPEAQYKVRVVYGGDSPKRKIRLVANDQTEVHPFLAKPVPFRPLEFNLPQEVTASGKLALSWFREPGLGGNGRGCQVSEIWLIKR
jgi:hypothetical protein